MGARLTSISDNATLDWEIRFGRIREGTLIVIQRARTIQWGNKQIKCITRILLSNGGRCWNDSRKKCLGKVQMSNYCQGIAFLLLKI